MELGSHEEVPCLPLSGLTASCVSSEPQLTCRAVWVHSFVGDAAVSPALNRCRISTHTSPPPIQEAGQLSLKVAQDTGLDTFFSFSSSPASHIPCAEHHFCSDTGWAHERKTVPPCPSLPPVPLEARPWHRIHGRKAQACTVGSR